jgi:hypothetical protein
MYVDTEMRILETHSKEDFLPWDMNSGKRGLRGEKHYYSVILCFANIKRKRKRSVICNANPVLIPARLGLLFVSTD